MLIGGQPGNKNAEKWTSEKVEKIGKDLLKWFDESPTNIFYSKFLLTLDYEDRVDRMTLTYLRAKFDSFSSVMDMAKEIQQVRLLDLGVLGILNPGITTFALKAIHGLVETDRHEVHTTGDTGAETHFKIEFVGSQSNKLSKATVVKKEKSKPKKPVKKK